MSAVKKSYIGISLSILVFSLAVAWMGYYMFELERHVESEISHLNVLISQLDPRSEQISAPLLEDAADVYQELGVLALSSGHYDLAYGYVSNAKNDARNRLEKAIAARIQAKDDVQNMIVELLNSNVSKRPGESQDTTRSQMDKIIRFETIDDKKTVASLQGLDHLLLLAYMSADLGFSGWDKISQQICHFAESIEPQSPKVALELMKLYDYSVDLMLEEE